MSVVFVLLDGMSTKEDDNIIEMWKFERDAAINRRKGRIKPRAIAAEDCRPNVDNARLKHISTSSAFRICTDLAALVTLFQYLSQSIVSSIQQSIDIDEPISDVRSFWDAVPNSL